MMDEVQPKSKTQMILEPAKKAGIITGLIAKSKPLIGFWPIAAIVWVHDKLEEKQEGAGDALYEVLSDLLGLVLPGI